MASFGVYYIYFYVYGRIFKVKFREYDISTDPDEPQQILSFVPERKKGHSFQADDAAEREVASFALGKGTADWGPLTVYAIVKSGDIFAICPYIPKNACVAHLCGPGRKMSC